MLKDTFNHKDLSANRNTLTCLECKRSFRVKSSRVSSAKTCSVKCWSVYRKQYGNFRSKRFVELECVICYESFRVRHVFRTQKTCSKYCRRVLLSKRHSVDKDGNWLGWTTLAIQKLRNSKRYAVWRKSIFERDDYTCQICFKRGYELQADHVVPFSYLVRNKLELWALNNGRTLCKSCHFKTDTYARKAIGYNNEFAKADIIKL